MVYSSWLLLLQMILIRYFFYPFWVVLFSSSGKEHHLKRKDVFIYVYKVQVNMVPYYASHFW